MALVHTIRVPVRVPVSDTRMGGSHTRMSEGDEDFNVEMPLVIRVWGRGYAYHTRMRGAIRVWVGWLADPELLGVRVGSCLTCHTRMGMRHTRIGRSGNSWSCFCVVFDCVVELRDLAVF